MNGTICKSIDEHEYHITNYVQGGYEYQLQNCIYVVNPSLTYIFFKYNIRI